MHRRRSLSVYWWAGVPNFGDLLTRELLRHFCGIRCQHATFATASLIGTGSIIEHIPDGWDGRIVGSGKLHEEAPFPLGPEVLALRGPLTARGLRGSFAIGDLGLLANELVRVETKRYGLGIVPHWSDKTLATDRRFAPYQPVVIDPGRPVLEVLRMIGECKKIVTSSLHGMIVADSFGIPRRLEQTPRLAREGGLFKFRDYLASIGQALTVGQTMLASHSKVEDRQSELYDVIRALA